MDDCATHCGVPTHLQFSRLLLTVSVYVSYSPVASLRCPNASAPGTPGIITCITQAGTISGPEKAEHAGVGERRALRRCSTCWWRLARTRFRRRRPLRGTRPPPGPRRGTAYHGLFFENTNIPSYVARVYSTARFLHPAKRSAHTQRQKDI